MNDSGDLTPPAPPVSTGGPVPPTEPPSSTPLGSTGRSWWSRYRRFVIPGGAVVVLAAAAAGALLLVLKPAATVEKMVPAGDNLLVIANVDPSVTQKVNLMRALHAFPDLKTDSAITAKLDQALKNSGLSFTGDVQPWLGAEAGFSAQVSLQDSKNMPAALYLVSRDDSKAAATLAKLRAGKWGSGYQWQDQTYNGISIAVGTPKSASQQAGAYAIVDHVVVIATSAGVIDEIIDADQGRVARLADSAAYKATLSGLPSDRLGSLYLDGHSVVSSIKKLATTPAMTASSVKKLADLDAFQGIGGTLSANGNGLVADLIIKVDVSKLTPATRQAMANAGHPDTVLRFVPRGSDAFLAFGNLNQTVKSLLDQAGTDPTVTSTTDAVGLTGPHGVLAHLTGDAGIELQVGSRVIPSGAILLGTDNAPAMSSFLKNVLTMTTELSGSTMGSSTLMPTAPTVNFKSTTYRGVVITSYFGLGTGVVASAFQPSYAVFDRMGILGSNVAEVKAVIDAHLSGNTVTGDVTYQTALSGSLKQPAAILYVNLASLMSAARRLSAESGLASVDTKTLDSLAPVQSLIFTAGSQADAMLERLFVVIK
ncbi:MAG TPA: DUF3352 domain-containing protein [Candidatus Dormibacteraeota bacterium]